MTDQEVINEKMGSCIDKQLEVNEQIIDTLKLINKKLKELEDFNQSGLRTFNKIIGRLEDVENTVSFMYDCMPHRD